MSGKLLAALFSIKEKPRIFDAIIILMIFMSAIYIFSHEFITGAVPDERAYISWAYDIYKFGNYTIMQGAPIIKVPPLHPLFISISYHIFGPKIVSAKLVSTFFGGLTAVLAYLMGGYMYNRSVGIIAGFFVLTSALIWEYSSRALSELQLAFFINLSVFLIYLTLNKGSRLIAGAAGFCLGLAYLTKELGLIVLPLLLFFVLPKDHRRKKNVMLLFTAVVVLSITILPWHYYVYTISGTPIGGIEKRLGSGFSQEILKGEVPSLAETVLTLNIHNYFSPWILTLFYISMIYALFSIMSRRNISDTLLFFTVLIFFIVFIAFPPMSKIRRFLPLIVPLYILSSNFLFNMFLKLKIPAQKYGKISIMVILTFFFGIIPIFGYYNSNEKFDSFDFFPLLPPLNTEESKTSAEIKLLSEKLPAGASILTNDQYILYFYSKGKFKPFGMPFERVEGGKKGVKIIYSGKTAYSTSIRKIITEEKLMYRINERDISYVVIFKNRRAAGTINYFSKNTDFFKKLEDEKYHTLYVYEIKNFDN